MDDGGQEIEPGQDHAEPDHREADQVRVHAAGALGLERGVTGPTRREAAEGQGRQDHEIPSAEHPERGGLDPGEGSTAAPDHEWDQVVAEWADDHRRGHHHHDGAVLSDDVDIGPGPKKVAGRREKFGADAHGQQTAREQEGENSHQVLDAHNLVVQREAEVARPVLLGDVGEQFPANYLRHGVIEGADAPEPAQHHERQGQAYGDVILPAALDVAVIARNDVAQPVADEVADNTPRYRGDHALLSPRRPRPPQSRRQRLGGSTTPGLGRAEVRRPWLVNAGLAVDRHLGIVNFRSLTVGGFTGRAGPPDVLTA